MQSTKRSEQLALCGTPTPGKQPTQIAKWKYDTVRSAILRILPRAEPGIEFRQLVRMVSKSLDHKTREALGSISWYTTTVKLEMEVNGEIQRTGGTRPQRLIRKR